MNRQTLIFQTRLRIQFSLAFRWTNLELSNFLNHEAWSNSRIQSQTFQLQSLFVKHPVTHPKVSPRIYFKVSRFFGSMTNGTTRWPTRCSQSKTIIYPHNYQVSDKGQEKMIDPAYKHRFILSGDSGRWLWLELLDLLISLWTDLLYPQQFGKRRKKNSRNRETTD